MVNLIHSGSAFREAGPVPRTAPGPRPRAGETAAPRTAPRTAPPGASTARSGRRGGDRRPHQLMPDVGWIPTLRSRSGGARRRSAPEPRPQTAWGWGWGDSRRQIPRKTAPAWLPCTGLRLQPAARRGEEGADAQRKSCSDAPAPLRHPQAPGAPAAPRLGRCSALGDQTAVRAAGKSPGK